MLSENDISRSVYNNLVRHFDLSLKTIQVPSTSQMTSSFQKIYWGQSLWGVRPCNKWLIWQEKLVLEFCLNSEQCLPEKEGTVWEVTGGQHSCLLFWTSLVVEEVSRIFLCSLTLHSIIEACLYSQDNRDILLYDWRNILSMQET